MHGCKLLSRQPVPEPPRLLHPRGRQSAVRTTAGQPLPEISMCSMTH